MSNHVDLIIIGAGPAGLSAATSAATYKKSYILFEKGEVGNTIYDYQLRKHVMAEPGRLPLRANIPFSAGTRERILDSWNLKAKELGVTVTKADVTAINKSNEHFEIEFLQNGVRSKCASSKVILAIGIQGSPRRLEVPGEELPHVSYTLSDPDAFVNKNIIVVGAGDAAIENALALCEKNKVTVINRGSEFAKAKDANSAAILSAIGSGQIKCFYDSQISKIIPSHVIIASPQGDVETSCDHLIARLGCIVPRKFVESCGITFPSKDPTVPPQVNEHYESNVPGLHIIGSLIGYPLIKQAINQGYEVIEHILGNSVVPADQPLIDEKLKGIAGSTEDNLKKIREALPFLKGLTIPQYREMITDSTIHLLKTGNTIFERNDYTDSLYSIVTGSVEIDLPTRGKITLGQGEFFGEIGLISGRRRSATVRASESCILLETPRKQIIKLASSVESFKLHLDRVFALRALQTAIFPRASRESLEALVPHISFNLAKKNDVIFREGEVGNAFYVIRKGSVKVSRADRSGTEIVQTYIPAGNYFGEMAILDANPVMRSATVIAAVPCELLVINKEAILEFLNANPAVRLQISQTANERKLENLLRDQDVGAGQILDFMFKEGVSDAENVLVIDSDLCVSCDNCETACAATHHGFSRLDRKGGKSFAHIQIPISCRHCENPLCMIDCPPDALVRKPNGEVIIQDSCIGCGNCVRNCPYGVIQMTYDNDKGFSLLNLLGLKKSEKGPAKAAKCDLCEGLTGGPACVRACPTGAAIRVNPSKLLQIVTERA